MGYILILFALTEALKCAHYEQFYIHIEIIYTIH